MQVQQRNKKNKTSSRAVKCSNAQSPIYIIPELPFLYTPYEIGNDKKGGDQGWKLGLAVEGWPRIHKSLGPILDLFS